MKSSNAELLAQLTELTRDLDFPFSQATNPIHPFLWEVEVQGELTIENLLKTETPNFWSYTDDGTIIQSGNLQEYWHFVLQEAQKHSLKIFQKYQSLIDLLQVNLSHIELIKVRTLHDSKHKFYIILGVTKSEEWVGISPNISMECDECHSMGIYKTEQNFLMEYQPQTDITANFLPYLQPILQDLEFYEPDVWGYYPDKGWTIRVGASKEFVVHSLLEAISFSRTFPVCQFFKESEYEEYEDGDEEMEELKLYKALDEFLAANLTNLRSYIFGVRVSYVLYVIGKTASGDWAGVTSMAVWG